ncbi:MAG: urease accessory protein UreF [Gallionellaceae bacterium]|nr:urease accessory protein UreF [Gallionellaceae bacterium]
MLEHIALSRLLQLASPLLPVGAYSYSQGLEWAIESGTVHDAESAQNWINDALELYLGRFELPVLWRLHLAWQADDVTALAYWNQYFCAGRETAESRAETLQMGYSLVRLLKELDGFNADITHFPVVTFPLAYACAASQWHIPITASVQAYAWSWAENQVSAAMKTIPLGQVAGQRMLLALGAYLPAAVQAASELKDDELSNFAPALTLAGCQHETQYSRLFRS